MEKLLELLKDGHARTVEMLANELGTSQSDVLRKLEYMENMGLIKKVSMTSSSCDSGHNGCNGCHGCTGCSTSAAGHDGCKSCMPDASIMNMGEMWEVTVPQ